MIIRIFPRAWPVGYIGLLFSPVGYIGLLFFQLDISQWMAWMPNYWCCVFFQLITKTTSTCLQSLFSQLVMLWVTMLMITIYIFFISDLIYQEWWKKVCYDQTCFWLLNCKCFLWGIFDCYINFKQLVIYMICLDIVYSFFEANIDVMTTFSWLILYNGPNGPSTESE